MSTVSTPSPTSDHVLEPVEMCIVGTGFSGIGLAMQRLAAGDRDLVVLEKADDVGGTWRDNTYPGCACDVPAHLYSFSFAPNPNWSRYFAPQPEIRAYLRQCAESSGVIDHVRFGARVVGLVWQAATARWWVQVDGGPDLLARHVALGVGGLHEPRIPDLPGADAFEGAAFHTARWDHDVELAGKRVAVIGTGASAIQVVPAIADVAAEVHVYQRSAPWVMRRPEHRFGRREQAALARIPGVQRLLRSAIYAWMELRGLGFTLHPAVMTRARALALEHIRSQIDDPHLVERVTPDYLPGCKRVLLSNDWYPALQKSSVTLVDGGARALDATGVVSSQGTHRPADVVVWATGFDVMRYLESVPVTGPHGTLSDAWSERVEAYLGTFVSGFPNLYLLMGPNTGLGHNSMVFMLEAQMHLVGRFLDTLAQRGEAAGSVTQRAQATFNRGLVDKLAGSVWNSGCTSWYVDEQGHNATIWPFFTFEFWRRTRRLRARDFRFW